MKNSRAVDTDANKQYIEGLVPGISRDLDLEGLTTEWDTTPVSTIPISGVETLEIMTGTAIDRIALCVNGRRAESRVADPSVMVYQLNPHSMPTDRAVILGD